MHSNRRSQPTARAFIPRAAVHLRQSSRTAPARKNFQSTPPPNPPQKPFLIDGCIAPCYKPTMQTTRSRHKAKGQGTSIRSGRIERTKPIATTLVTCATIHRVTPITPNINTHRPISTTISVHDTTTPAIHSTEPANTTSSQKTPNDFLCPKVHCTREDRPIFSQGWTRRGAKGGPRGGSKTGQSRDRYTGQNRPIGPVQ